MFDRLISGAGAVSAGLDRFVRNVTPGSAMGNQPVSLLVAALLGVIALLLVVVGLESSGSSTLQRLDPAAIAAADDLGNRVYATVEGRIPSTYVESFPDADFDGVQDPEEIGDAWDYFLLGKDVDEGLIVRSQRPPSEIYTFQGSGVVVEDPEYLGPDLELVGTEFSVPGLTLDPTHYIDATAPAEGAPLDLATGLPDPGTAVTIDASRAVEYLPFCATDPDGDGVCDEGEIDMYDVIVYDPVTLRGVVVATNVSPESTTAAFTGVLRRDVGAIDRSVNAPGVTMEETGIQVSPVYLLDEGATPVDPTSLFLLAGILGVVAAVIAIGVAGGYVQFSGGGPLPPAASTFAPGERLAVGVTGALRAPKGLLHVREAPAEVVRFVGAEPASPETAATPAEPTDPSEAVVEDAPDVTPDAATATTMIVERRDRPEGVAVGRGELESIESGTVATFRARHPALRLKAATGALVLSFEDEDARDRVAAELAAERATPDTTEEQP